MTNKILIMSTTKCLISKQSCTSFYKKIFYPKHKEIVIPESKTENASIIQTQFKFVEYRRRKCICRERNVISNLLWYGQIGNSI